MALTSSAPLFLLSVLILSNIGPSLSAAVTATDDSSSNDNMLMQRGSSAYNTVNQLQRSQQQDVYDDSAVHSDDADEESLASVSSTIRYTMSGFMELCRRRCFTHDRLDCVKITCNCLDYKSFDVMIEEELVRLEEMYATQQEHRVYSSFLKSCLGWCEEEDEKGCVHKKCRCIRAD